MTTSLSNAKTIEWIGASDGTQYVVKRYSEGTSETFLAGDLVIYDASENGIVELAQGDGGVFGDSTNDEVADSTAFLGIALQAASGTAGTELDVLIPRPQDLFACVLYSTDNTTIVAPDTDNIGTLVDLIKGNTANNNAVGVLESTASTPLWCKVVDIDPQETIQRGGTIGQGLPTLSAGDRVIVQFQTSALDGIGYQA